MATVYPPISPSVSTPLDGEFCGVFVIGADGKVVASNASARQLWSAENRPLVGISFAALFDPAEPAVESQDASAEWQAFKRDAWEQWMPRGARRHDGPTCEVRVRLERAYGGAGSYIATVRL